MKNLELNTSKSFETRNLPIHRWYPYLEGFSPLLVKDLIEKYTEKGDLVFDPFVGSGTTLVEALKLERVAKGLDLNPLAVLMSRVKGNWKVDYRVFKEERKELFLDLFKLFPTIESKRTLLGMFIEKSQEKLEFDKKEIEIIKGDNWYSDTISKKLWVIKKRIMEISNEEIRNIFLLGLISILFDVSNLRRDGSTTMKMKKQQVEDAPVLSLFKRQMEMIESDIKNFPIKNVCAEVWEGDIKNLHQHMNENTVDFIVTSPPYIQARGYLTSYRFALILLNSMKYKKERNELNKRIIGHPPHLSDVKLDLDKFTLTSQTIEKLEENNAFESAKIIRNYAKSMFRALHEINRILRGNRRMAMTIGNTVHSNVEIKLNEIIIELTQDQNFSLIKREKIRDLPTTTILNGWFGKGASEELLIFKKIGS